MSESLCDWCGGTPAPHKWLPVDKKALGSLCDSCEIERLKIRSE
jgi:hypothetical protein